MRYLTYNVLGWAYEIVKKLRPFKTICIYKSGQKLQIIFFTSFLCNCKKELMSGPEIDKSLDSEACILVRIWAVILYFGPKYLNTFCMKYWHNTTLSVTNSIFLILQTNYKIAKGKLRILKKNLLLLVCFIPLPSDLILWRCVWFWIRPNRLPKSVR